jgi:hypothetical protein
LPLDITLGETLVRITMGRSAPPPPTRKMTTMAVSWMLVMEVGA